MLTVRERRDAASPDISNQRVDAWRVEEAHQILIALPDIMETVDQVTPEENHRATHQWVVLTFHFRDAFATSYDDDFVRACMAMLTNVSAGLKTLRQNGKLVGR